MSAEVAAAAISTQAPVAPPPAPLGAGNQEAALSQLLGLDDAPVAPAAKAEAAQAATTEAASKPANGTPAPAAKAEPIDPLDPADFELSKLGSPEAIQAAADRLIKAHKQALELTRAAHRSHGAAKGRETRVKSREEQVEQREGAIAAYDRTFQANMSDLQSGDPDKFLTAIHRLGNVGDPAGFWRNLSVKLASGGKITEPEKRQAQADPEIQRRIEQIENALRGGAAAQEEQQVELLKSRNFEFAAKHEATPRVVAYASDPRTAAYTREALAEIMEAHYAQTKRPLTIQQACETLEENLAVHFELSQRADGKTNGEKGTTGLEPEAGRATSQEPPKPATSQATSIPASLSNSPGAAQKPLSEEEQRALQIRQLEAAGFF